MSYTCILNMNKSQNPRVRGKNFREYTYKESESVRPTNEYRWEAGRSIVKRRTITKTSRTIE